MDLPPHRGAMDRDPRQAIFAAIGLLDPEEAVELARARQDDPDLDAEVCAWEEVASWLAIPLPPSPAPPHLLRSLLEETADGPERFAPLLARLARLLDVALESARDQVQRLFVPTEWLAFPFDGITLMHLPGGPITAGADVGFVRVEAGHPFPPHTHLGTERVLVLQGGFRDSDGTVHRAGDSISAEGGTTHHFVALQDEPLIYAVVVFGVSFEAGLAIPHDDDST